MWCFFLPTTHPKLHATLPRTLPAFSRCHLDIVGSSPSIISAERELPIVFHELVLNASASRSLPGEAVGSSMQNLYNTDKAIESQATN